PDVQYGLVQAKLLILRPSSTVADRVVGGGSLYPASPTSSAQPGVTVAAFASLALRPERHDGQAVQHDAERQDRQERVPDRRPIEPRQDECTGGVGHVTDRVDRGERLDPRRQERRWEQRRAQEEQWEREREAHHHRRLRVL